MKMNERDVHYLRSILAQLHSIRLMLHEQAPSLVSEVLSDNIDWLDCFIEDR